MSEGNVIIVESGGAGRVVVCGVVRRQLMLGDNPGRSVVDGAGRNYGDGMVCLLAKRRRLMLVYFFHPE